MWDKKKGNEKSCSKIINNHLVDRCQKAVDKPPNVDFPPTPTYKEVLPMRKFPKVRLRMTRHRWQKSRCVKFRGAKRPKEANLLEELLEKRETHQKLTEGGNETFLSFFCVCKKGREMKVIHSSWNPFFYYCSHI